MVHDGRGGDGTAWRLLAPGAHYDYEAQAGDLWRNSAVAACLRVLKTNFAEPSLGVAVLDADGNENHVAGHELPTLLDKPNKHYDGGVLWGATVLSLKTDGNAYWLKVYSRLGKLVELWWVPPWLIKPVWPADGSQFIAKYRYEVNGRYYYLDPSDVVHFRQGLDPRNDRLGLADLKAAVREVATDNEASTFIAAVLRNMGVPTVVISPLEQGGTFAEGVPDDIRSQWRSNQTGERRGDPLVSDSLKVERLSLSPKEMSLADIPDRLEDRICALLGVPAMLAGLTSGATHKTYANYGEGRKSLYEDTIIPDQRAVARVLTMQVLCDFHSPQGAYVRWIYKGIQCLRENENELATRAGVLYYDKKLIKRSEARQMIGLASTPADDLYYDEIVAAQASPTRALPAPPAVKSLSYLKMSPPRARDMPEGDEPDPHEDNTYGLPDGAPLRKALKRFLAKQYHAVLGSVPEIGAPLPATFAPLADYDDPMASAMTPIFSSYWDWAGQQTRGKLGLDPATWQVVDPEIHRAIADSALSFSRSTNAGTSKGLAEALAKLRSELHEGIVAEGEAIPQLRKRVQGVFEKLSRDKAEMIARTETSRAVHTASLRSAGDSGVVETKSWLASTDACPLCLGLEAETKEAGIPLDQPFTVQGTNPAYSEVESAPGHPHCRCTVVFNLTSAYRDLIETETGRPAPKAITPLDAAQKAIKRSPKDTVAKP
jgi:HK97 family phage portal protein